MVLRDRTGLKPAVLGRKDGKYLVASEDSAIRENEGVFVEDITPGSVYYLNAEGDYKREVIVEPAPQHCFFEYNYLAAHDSIMNGVSVRRVRELLGIALSDEAPLEKADIVTYIPRSPELTAQVYARAEGIPFERCFYKMRGERSFQGPTPEERLESISHNLYLSPLLAGRLVGKAVENIDDSLIHGNNAGWALKLLAEGGGASNAMLTLYTPEVGIIGADGIARGCMFGVDMPPTDNFIARGRSIEEISKEVGMRVRYLSLEGMLSAFAQAGMPPENLCTYCIGGRHPFDDR